MEKLINEIDCASVVECVCSLRALHCDGVGCIVDWFWILG